MSRTAQAARQAAHMIDNAVIDALAAMPRTIKAALQHTFLLRNAAAIAAIAALALPWIELDRASPSAAELIAQALTGPERGMMFAMSPAGAIALFAAPPAVLALCILAWKAEFQRKPSAMLNAAPALLPLLMLFIAAGLNPDSRIFGIMAAPQPGILITMLAHALLTAHRLTGGRTMTVTIPALRPPPAKMRLKRRLRRNNALKATP